MTSKEMIIGTADLLKNRFAAAGRAFPGGSLTL